MAWTAGQVYKLLRDAGFSAASAVTLTAIAKGESGWNPTAKGDTTITTDKWGPSVGLFQIRTLKAETGTGKDRDINALLASPARQAKAAYEISNGGTNWQPWSVYTSGKYKSYLGEARQAATAGGEAPPADSTGGTAETGEAEATESGSAWSPAAIMTKLKPILLEGAGVLMGLALIGTGIGMATGVRQRALAVAKATPVGGLIQ